MSILIRNMYCAIRKPIGGQEYFDQGTFGPTAEDAKHHVDMQEESIPNWASEHPLMRIVLVSVMEELEEDKC